MLEKIMMLLIMFGVYAVMGWMAEVVFFTLKTGKFINRGFLNGPLCPLYGFGVVGVVIIMSPIKDNILLLFFGSMIFCTVIEYITGVILNKLFNDRWWDYSDKPFNIKGYVCLGFSLMWGFACVSVIRVVHPVVYHIIDIMPMWLEIVIAAVFYVYVAADLVVTVRGINKVNRRLREMAEHARDISDTTGYYISEAARSIDEKTDELRDEIDERVEEKKERNTARRDAFIAFMSEPEFAKHGRLMKAFPGRRKGMKERIIKAAGEEFREQIEDFFESKFKKVD